MITYQPGVTIFQHFALHYSASILAPHEKLLINLATFEIDEKFLLLFKSYLSNRTQCVKVDQSVSKLKNVTSGFPQDSVLGPLLFTLFINDISDNLQYTKALLYADDLKTWVQIFSSACAIQLNSDINSLTLWADDNGMILKLAKNQKYVFWPGTIIAVYEGCTHLRSQRN